ncbi:polyisoprenoid-binding protein [Algimonas arctica]|uniref:Polyisoprenoid-binding protein n=1 Tax=Algimonas arctica TaxID=1479486 RepID=A0A8J3G3B1_9PROT|nr:YceI family protein [Algimonas arctica]GHB00671.1 polyisoprenoid-binding protein [Algimonas arctica]
MRFVILLSALLFSACRGETVEPEIQAPAFETNYVVANDESRLGFAATQEGVVFTGEFTDFEALIYFDPEELEASRVLVSVPLASFDGGSTDRNSNASSNIWFDAKKFPVAVFESQLIREDGNAYIAQGTLMLKGQTKQILFPFKLNETDGRTVMTATFPINRTRWDVGQSPWNTEGYVGLDVILDLRIVADRAP